MKYFNYISWPVRVERYLFVILESKHVITGNMVGLKSGHLTFELVNIIYRLDFPPHLWMDMIL